jgi:hypothetical protein
MPLFATAPRLKLRIQDKLVAYAVGFNIAVSVDIQPVFVIGSYAPISLEPTLYNTVTGTMQIVRLLSSTTLAAKAAVTDPATGNVTTPAQLAYAGVDGAELTSSGAPTDGAKSNSPLEQRELFKHVDPEKLLLSRTFDVAVYMKVPNAAGDGLEELAWMAIRDCRITSRNTNIAMGQLVNEPVSFQGLLATHTSDPTNQFEKDGSVTQSVVTT